MATKPKTSANKAESTVISETVQEDLLQTGENTTPTVEPETISGETNVEPTSGPEIAQEGGLPIVGVTEKTTKVYVPISGQTVFLGKHVIPSHGVELELDDTSLDGFLDGYLKVN
jgi:hypothetical protein